MRETEGWTQEELAKKTKLGQTTISALERGALENPSMDTLKALAKAFKIEARWIVEVSLTGADWKKIF